jgi:PhnB protein
MRLDTYLSFDGTCEEAFEQYARCFAGQLGPIARYGGSPMAGDAPDHWADKVMHGSVNILGHVIMGADPPPDRYEAPRGFTLNVQIATVDEAERVFRELSAGGNVIMPLQQTFWAARFGVCVDRFGIPWQVNCEAPLEEIGT